MAIREAYRNSVPFSGARILTGLCRWILGKMSDAILALSTRSAARYLKWMRSKLGDGSGPGSWLTAAAAYNAGFSVVRVQNGLGTGPPVFGT